MTARIVEIRQNVLNKNDQLAARLRARFEDAGLYVLNLMSSPGSGKTRFLEETLRLLGKSHRAAALVGDLATENDANRLARSGAPVRQIVTAGMCHLEAEMIEQHLLGWELSELDFLFIENVGNLVCPSSYDLGEQCRVVLLSVTEGEDKPLKYPSLFHTADVAILTKMDLAEVCEFDRDAARAALRDVQPDIRIFETSAKTGAGMDAWIAFLTDGVQRTL